MDKEIYKPIKLYNYNNGKSYKISNWGNVKINNEVVNLKDNGYLSINGYFIHRMVAKAFIPNPYNKPEVDHIDGNKYNNHVDNLRWVTHKENMNNPITKQKIKAGLKRMINLKLQQQ